MDISRHGGIPKWLVYSGKSRHEVDDLGAHWWLPPYESRMSRSKWLKTTLVCAGNHRKAIGRHNFWGVFSRKNVSEVCRRDCSPGTEKPPKGSYSRGNFSWVHSMATPNFQLSNCVAHARGKRKFPMGAQQHSFQSMENINLSVRNEYLRSRILRESARDCVEFPMFFLWK